MGDFIQRKNLIEVWTLKSISGEEVETRWIRWDRVATVSFTARLNHRTPAAPSRPPELIPFLRAKPLRAGSTHVPTQGFKICDTNIYWVCSTFRSRAKVFRARDRIGAGILLGPTTSIERVFIKVISPV